jgi:DNA-binding NarL/FixJ family response regulator
VAEGSELSVALLDDHEVVRSGLARVLQVHPGIHICGEASNLVEAVDLARETTPDIFVVDIGLPGENGIVAIQEIRKICPETKIVVLTMYDDISYLRAAFAAGAGGYVLKQTAAKDIVTAVLIVAAGGEYVDPALGAAVLRDGSVSESRSNLNLSPREIEVLRLLAHGYTNNEVAKALTISARTAETHRARIQQKLGVKSRAELAQIARAAGLLD